MWFSSRCSFVFFSFLFHPDLVFIQVFIPVEIVNENPKNNILGMKQNENKNEKPNEKNMKNI